MSTNYIATVHKPTAVTDAACGTFFHHTHPDLILAKGNILEFWSVLTDPKTQSVRLELDKDFQIFGEIAALKLIKPLSRRTPSKPLLFFITEKHHVAFVEPSCDAAPTECTPGAEHLGSDEEPAETIKGRRSRLPSIGNDLTRRKRVSPNSRDKIDILLQKHYDETRGHWDPRTLRSRSCVGLFGRGEDQLRSDRQPTLFRSQLSELAHLRGPFWDRIKSARGQPLTAETEQDRSRFEPITATWALKLRLGRLATHLLEKLFTLRPLLKRQLDELGESGLESDVEMSEQGESAEAAMEVESPDEDHPMEPGIGLAADEPSDEFIGQPSGPSHDAGIGQLEAVGPHKRLAGNVQTSREKPAPGPVLAFCEDSLIRPGDGADKYSDAHLTALLHDLMGSKRGSDIKHILARVAVILSKAPSPPEQEHSSVHSLAGGFQRRSISVGPGFDLARFGAVRPPSTMLNVASCAEAAECVAGNQHLRTRASGKVRDRSGRPCENGVVCAISSDHAVIALSLIVGAIKFIAVKATLNNSEGNVEHFNARVEPCRVLDMQFLSSGEHSNQRRRALCILFQDVQGESKLCIYDLSLREKYLRRAPRSADSVEVSTMKRKRPSRLASELNPLASLAYDGTTNHVIPTALGGAMFVGEKNVTFYPRLMVDHGQQAMAGQEVSEELYYLRSDLAFQHFRYITSWAAVGPSDSDLKYVMCEQGGHLLLAWLALPKSAEESSCPVGEADGYSLKVDYIGPVTNASVMVALPYNHLFLGSRHGDSQLVRLESTSKIRSGTHRCPFRAVHVISTFYNLAPVVDMCLVPTTRHKYVDEDRTRQGEPISQKEDVSPEGLMQPTHQRTLVTCSNVGPCGTLRFLRNGLGLQRLFFCRTPQLCSAFGLGSFSSNIFLLSYPMETVLAKLTWPEPQAVVPPSQPDEPIPAPRRLFAIEGIDSGEYGFDLRKETLAVEHNDELLCQATCEEIRLFSARHFGLAKAVDCWAPADKSEIFMFAASLEARIIVVGCGASSIFRLAIRTSQDSPNVPNITTTGNKRFHADFLSCLALSCRRGYRPVVVCGFSLTGYVRVVDLTSFETLQVFRSACANNGIPRSLALTLLGDSMYVVVGDSTGCLSYAEYFPTLSKTAEPPWKKIKLSSEPTFIRSMKMSHLMDPCERWEGPRSVLFIGGVHPLVMCAPKQGKLTLVNVNAQNIVAVDGWSNASGDYLLTVSENFQQTPELGKDNTEWVDRIELSVCRLNGLNQVQVKTLNLYETPRRIVYHPSSDCLAVLVYHNIPDLKRAAASVSLQSDFRNCASYQAPRSEQLFDQQAGRPFAAGGDVIRPATKRKSKDDSDPLVEESRSRQASDGNDSAHPVRWDSAADQKLLERWADREEHAILLINRSDLNFRTSFFLRPDEHGCSIAVCTFKDDQTGMPREYLVVGTGMVKSGEIEPTSGRVLIFEVDAKNPGAPLLLLSENDVDGAVYSIGNLEGLLVATINCRVKLFGFTRSRCYASGKIPNPALTLYQTHSTNSLALYVKTKLNRCLVGDLLRSLELFELEKRSDATDQGASSSEEYRLVSVARDHNPNWVTAIEIISPEVFVATENFCNLFVCTSQAHHVQSDGVVTEQAADADREPQNDSIREVSLLHIGEFVNVIRSGSLVSQISPSCGAAPRTSPRRVYLEDAFCGRGLFDRNRNVNVVCHVKGSFLLGSTGGWIGQMMCISRPLYIFLWEIQKRLQTCLKSIGRIDHGEWRAFESEMKVEASSGFIDGSLMESLVDMDPRCVLDMLRGVRIENTEVTEVEHLQPLFRLLEEMSRLH